MVLNLITRCTRTTKIREIFESFYNQKKSFEIKWFILFDLNSLLEIPSDLLKFLNDKAEIRFYESEPNDFGHDLINKTLDEIENGLVYVLDDDNIFHPNFFPIIDFWIQNHFNYDGVIFSQKVGGVDFSGLDIRESKPENVVVSKIDMAQFCLKRELIGNHRIPKYKYVGDGIFIEELYKTYPDRFLFVTDVGCYYNYFKQSGVVDYFLPRVLVIGDNNHTELTTTKYFDFEDNRLKLKHIEDDTHIQEVLSDFKPDGIISTGESWHRFSNLSIQSYDFRRKWIHLQNLTHDSGEIIFNSLNNSMFDSIYETNPLISVFTPIYNTGEKLLRTYESMKNQSYNNWEWVLTNDSTDEGKTLKIAKYIQRSDPRVKVYDLNPKSGGIVGESKYRAACLCRGKYLIELDHDDVLHNEALEYTLRAFNTYSDVKFVYSDCAEIDENHNSLTYGDNFAFGYGSYRDEEYNGKVYKAANTQNINPKTIRHIVGVPNHLRAWERFFYHSIGGHNRCLSIADDYELLVRTFLKTRFVRIPKMLYLQFYHDSNTQNTSRADIQRRVRSISKYYDLKIKARFEELGVEDWAYDSNPNWPTNTESRYGDSEGKVNYIMDLETSNQGYDSSKLGSFSLLN